MTCEDVERRDLAEDYLLGRLSETDRDAFERHYFGCAECYARLEALRAVKDALAPGPQVPARVTTTSWPGLALAAAIVITVAGAVLAWRAGAGDGTRPGPAPAVVTATPAPDAPRIPADVLHLARVEAPPYSGRRLRSGAGNERFAAGMKHYQAGDFAAAIPLLESAANGADDLEAARFYLGAAYAMTSRWREAVETLRPIAARRDSAYAEEAAFITARAHVHLGDVPAALAALDATMAFNGERHADAKTLRERLAILRSP